MQPRSNGASIGPGKPRSRLLRWAIGALAGLIVAIASGSWAWSWYSRWEAIATTCAWARVAPLPVPAGDADVAVKGSMFTREFVVSFKTDGGSIARWLAASPGPSASTPMVDGSTRVFTITPGGGAEFAEVRVDDATGLVRIRVYWS